MNGPHGCYNQGLWHLSHIKKDYTYLYAAWLSNLSWILYWVYPWWPLKEKYFGILSSTFWYSNSQSMQKAGRQELTEVVLRLEIGHWTFKIFFSNKIDPPLSRIFKYLILETSIIFRLILHGNTSHPLPLLHHLPLPLPLPLPIPLPLPLPYMMYTIGTFAKFSTDLQPIYPSQY